MAEPRVSLNREEFKALVRGKEIVHQSPQGPVRVILADIGWGVMIADIEDAAEE